MICWGQVSSMMPVKKRNEMPPSTTTVRSILPQAEPPDSNCFHAAAAFIVRSSAHCESQQSREPRWIGASWRR